MEWVSEHAHAFTMKRDNRAGSERYQITVALPHGYEAPDLNSKYTNRFSPSMKKPRKRYPAVFILEAEPCLMRLFEIQAQAMAFFKCRDRGTAKSSEFLVVGVSHIRKPNESEPAYWKRIQPLKARDFLPTAGPAGSEYHGSAGKAAAFFDFVSTALVPHIEACYNVQPKQHTLVGTGLSGAFGIYSLWRQPSLFRHYIVASPLLCWDHNFLIAKEDSLRAKGRPPTARLLVLIGDQEGDRAKAGAKLLEGLLGSQGHYAGVSSEFATLEGVDEHSLIPSMAGRGLSWVSSCLSQAQEARRQANGEQAPDPSLPLPSKGHHPKALPPWDADITIVRDKESGAVPSAIPQTSGRSYGGGVVEDVKPPGEPSAGGSPRPMTPEVCDSPGKSEGMTAESE